MRRDAERLARRAVGALHECHDLGRNATVQRDVFLEQRHDAARKCLDLVELVGRRLFLDGHELGTQMLTRWHITSDAYSREPFDEDFRRAARCPCQLSDAGADAT